MASNVIELVVRVRDQYSTPLRNLNQTLGKVALVGIGAMTVALAKVVKATSEAQIADAKLDAAFKGKEATIGRTRESLDDLATSIQRTTTFDDDLVKSAQSVLLMFNKVRGEGFERTIRAATDLSAKLGTDLVSTTRLLGVALQDPVRGMERLRRSGIVLDQSQKDLIKRLAETGRVGEAQAIILGEIEKQAGGTAQAIRGTLGGALTALNNAYTDLFEMSTEATDGLTTSIEGFTQFLQDPATKQAVQDFFGLIIRLAEKAVQTILGLGVIFGVVGDKTEQINRDIERLTLRNQTIEGAVKAGLGGPLLKDEYERNKARILELGKLQQDLIDQAAKLRRVKAASVTGTGETTATTGGLITDATSEQIQALQPVAVTAKRIVDDLNEALKNTETEAQQARRAFDLFMIDLRRVREAGLITPEDFNARLQERLDKDIPEVEVTVQKITLSKTAVAEVNQMGVQMARNIQDALAQAFDQGGNIRDFLRNVLSAFRTIIANAAAMDLGKLLGLDRLAGGGSGGSALGGLLKGAVSFIGGLFGNAQGGLTGGLVRVGEGGPENVILPPGSRVMNQRQMQFAGAGSGPITFAPQTTITMMPTGDPRRDQQRMQEELARRDQELMNQWVRTMERNGYGRMR